ncbi:MAG: hypothetical protein Q4G34_00180 [Micrococcus sp.]|nr:hypothetical protein [Micrococcus sp.]
MRPTLTIGSRAISGGAQSTVAAHADLDVTWGTSSVYDEPEPSKLSMSVLWRDNIDPNLIRQGTPVMLRANADGAARTVFAGRIQSLRARAHGRGRLTVNFTAVDSLQELRAHYVQTRWPRDPEGTTDNFNRLLAQIGGAGWRVYGRDTLPPQPWPNAETVYDSITVYTLLRRYLAQFGPQVTFWDVSRVDPDGTYRPGLRVGYAAAVQEGDSLHANPGGRLSVGRVTPAGLSQVHAPAEHVLRDVEWQSDADSLRTTCQIGYQVTRTETNEGTGEQRRVTSLSEVSTSLGAAVDEHGSRSLEFVTSASAPPAELRRMGRAWLQYVGHEWSPGALTVEDLGNLDPAAQAACLDVDLRRRAWWIVPGVGVPTPLGGLSSIRGVALGGELSYTGERGGRWSSSMTLKDQQIITPRDFTFEDLSSHHAPAISDAPASSAGDVRFADFLTISRLEATA